MDAGPHIAGLQDDRGTGRGRKTRGVKGGAGPPAYVSLVVLTVNNIHIGHARRHASDEEVRWCLG